MNLNAGINLRPWREERRQKRQKNFTHLSLLALVFGLLISALLWKSTTSSVAAIEEENRFIKDRMTQLDTEIKEVSSLREKRQQLLKRIEVIQQLQNNRPVTVELMDQLAASMNDGVYLTEITRTENQLLLQGQARPSQAVAAWMRSLDEQARFSEPILRSLITDEKTGLTRFDLLLPLQEPKK